MTDSAGKSPGSDWAALVPGPMVPVANLLTPQWGAAAAVSVASLGVATQMWGLWAGAVASMLDFNRDPAGHRPVEAPVEGTGPADVDALKTIIRNRADAGRRPVTKHETPRAARAAGTADKDDLKRISGVGPKLEQVLNAMGIGSYAQIAAWTEQDIAQVEERLKFGGRISRDDWLGQARRLADEV
ncbi:MAG: 5' DNA nuclease [Phyllobacterium sp.]